MSVAARARAPSPARNVFHQDEAAYHQHIARVPVPVAMFDLDLAPLAVSAGWLQAGLPGQGILLDHFVGEALAKARDRCLAGEVVNLRLESRADTPQGARWWEMAVTPWSSQPGPVERIILNGREVTEVVQAAFAATRAQQRLAMALKLDRSVVHEADLATGETLVVAMCPELERFFPREDPLAAVEAGARTGARAAYRACAELGTAFHLEYRLERDDGEETWIDAIGERFEGLGGTASRVITVFKDVTERRRHQQRIEALAYRDTLTGLSNRAAFQAALSEATAAAQLAGEGFGVVMIDLDHFKPVNDTFGHDVGDALLNALAGQLRRAFRQSDTVARLGGDEFAVLLRDVRGPQSLMRPIAVLESLLRIPFEHAGQSFVISTSIGAALHVPGEADPARVLKNADLAMYEAKAAGRGRAILFEDAMRAQVEERLELLREVRLGLADREFHMAYQPIFALADEEVVGLEAVLRWQHPQRGLLTPGDFGAAFDDLDSAPALADFAFEAVLEQVRAWLDAELSPPPVSINVSASQLRDGRLVRELPGKLARWAVPAAALAIEVNETMGKDRVDASATQAMRALSAAGLKITWDNFGAAQGSLGNPRDFPVDRLKIAKRFISDFDPQVVGSILRLGQALGLQVVADGVEDESALASLRALGCAHAQGFHFARPVPASEVRRFLRVAP